MQHRNLPRTYPAGKGSKPVCGLKLKRTSHLWPAGGSLVWKRRERTGPWFSQASKELRNRPRVCRVTCNGCMAQPRFPFLRLLPQLGRLFYCDSQVVASPSFLPVCQAVGPTVPLWIGRIFPLALKFPLSVSGPLLTPELFTAASISTGGVADPYSVDICQMNAYGPC